jgi:hypothetical protein
MINYYRLPFYFDPNRLKADLGQIEPDEWARHFNTAYYEGEWSGVSLRSVGGVKDQLYPDPTAEGRFADTPLLARCPYFQEVLVALPFPKDAVRLLKLQAGSNILEHRDYKLGYEDGFIRLHLPIETNRDVAFYLDGQRVDMQPGECWYLNFNLPHRVENHSATDRIHLVIDGAVNEWVQTIFAQAEPDRFEKSVGSEEVVSLPLKATKLYRGNAEGRIFESADNGQSWHMCADFGPACPILEVWPENNHIYAKVGSQNSPFLLKSTDGRHWRAN